MLRLRKHIGGPMPTPIKILSLVVILLTSTLAVGQDSFSFWFRQKMEKSERYMFANISPQDLRGVVLASPSRANPDYYYHWIRDAALVMKVVVQRYGHIVLEIEKRSKYEQAIQDYVAFSK